MTDEFADAGGEEVIWAGAPDPRKLLTVADAWLLPLGVLIPVGGIAISLQAPTAPRIGSVIIWTSVGLFLLAGRFIVKSQRKRRTRYVLTDRRALILRSGKTFAFEITPAVPHIEVQRTERHITLKFTNDDPGSYGVAGSELAADTGLDFLVHPGRSARFAFFDVPRTAQLDDVLDAFVRTGRVVEGIA
ncbi:hypothetical protein [Microbacterium ureisolvens]|uniref:PH domain-containing protein n=1 Tax=Microbacterium ureisolvens TaxID=2781186 RepID=A0ABS7HY95_9MICO|nr:hypothetical protein [Microbacterium ureisolvens]MBW9110028.1 hypothetical protein [Microbacterium ureisolvens]